MTVIVFSVKLHVSLIHLCGEVLCVSKPGMLARHFSEATVGFKSKLTALAHSGFFLQTILFCFLKLGIDYTKVIFISNCFVSNQAQFPEILLYNDVIVIT